MIDLSAVPLVDHHCHPWLADQEIDLPRLRRAFTESPYPTLAAEHVADSVAYRWSLRTLGRALGCPPEEEALLERRRELGLAGYLRQLWPAAGMAWLLLDIGYPARQLAAAPAEIAALTVSRVATILRLERLVEELVPLCPSLAELEARFDAALLAAMAPADGPERVVALKSIVAYRGGFPVLPRTRAEVEAGFAAARAVAAEGALRLTQKPLIDHLLLRALRFAAARELPMQLHTGYGDPDLDLLQANPLLLRNLFEDPELRGAPIVLLHGSYPYTRQAAYLAAVYPNAYLDLGYAIPFLDLQEMLAVTRQALGTAPWTKLLASSDGAGLPELIWLGAVNARRVLGEALAALVAADELDEAEALAAAHAILHGNAERLYRLGTPLA